MSVRTLRYFVAVGALVGGAVGTTTTLQATTKQGPNQCYNSDGGTDCPVCAYTCLGQGYICCTIVVG